MRSSSVVLKNEKSCSVRSKFIEKIAELHSKLNSSELFATIGNADSLTPLEEPSNDIKAAEDLEHEIDVLSRINFNESWPYISLVPILSIELIAVAIIWKIKAKSGRAVAQKEEKHEKIAAGSFVSFLEQSISDASRISRDKASDDPPKADVETTDVDNSYASNNCTLAMCARNIDAHGLSPNRKDSNFHANAAGVATRHIQMLKNEYMSRRNCNLSDDSLAIKLCPSSEVKWMFNRSRSSSIEEYQEKLPTRAPSPRTPK